jgi:prolipoprotein diacylglyceryltransferase
MIFGARFFIEFVKIGQTARDFEWTINTGQLLSIPFVLMGIYLIYRSTKSSNIEKFLEIIFIIRYSFYNYYYNLKIII